jgi:hypothetical protein
MRGAVFIHDDDVLLIKRGAGGEGVWDFYGHNILPKIGGRVAMPDCRKAYRDCQ